MPVVALLGDVFVDLLLPVPGLPQSGGEAVGCGGSLALGGSAVHTARWLAAWGLEVRVVGCVGRDPLGEFAVQEMARSGVPTGWLQRTEDLLTGVCCVMGEPSGERTMLAYRGANTRLSGADIPGGWLQDVDWLHISGYTLLESAPREAAFWAAARAREAGPPVSLDPGMAVVHQGRARPLVEELGWVDVILPNLEEAQALTGHVEPEQALTALAPLAGTVLLKGGASGSYVQRRDGVMRLPALPVAPQDTTGAGDAFNAGAIVAALSGEDEAAQGGLGNLLGALAGRGGPAAPPGGRSAARGLLDRLAQRRVLPEELKWLSGLVERCGQGGAFDS